MDPPLAENQENKQIISDFSCNNNIHDKRTCPVTRFLKREIATTALSAAYDIHTEENSHLKDAIEILRTDERVNLTIYFNHLTFDDPAAIFVFNKRYVDPRGKRQLVIPASYWHTDPRNKNNFSWATNAAEIFYGARTIRIVQNYQIENPKYGYTTLDAYRTYKELIKQIRDLRSQNIPITAIISPEGHRSEDGLLQKGDEGIVHIGRILSPIVYLPIGISFPDGFNRERLNTRRLYPPRRICLKVGKPEYQMGRRDNSVNLERLMRNLAETLPSEMRGVWR